MENVKIHPSARKLIRSWPIEVKKELGVILMRLQIGESIGMPDVRRMPSIGKGASEIRIQGSDGIYRTFYILLQRHGVLVFHAFKKKTQKTPLREISTAKRRLADLLEQQEE